MRISDWSSDVCSSDLPIAPLSTTNMDSLSLASDADPDRVAAHPRVQRVPAKDITLFIRRDFLNDEECASLIARIEANRRPSTTADANEIGRASYRERVFQYV